MKIKKIIACIFTVAFLCIGCSAQILTSTDVIGEFTVGSRLTVIRSSSSYRSPYAPSVTLRDDGTYTAGSWCFPVDGKYVHSNNEIILKAGVRISPRCFVSIPVSPDEAERLKNPPPPKDQTLKIIRWSGRLYLLVENRWESFINAINGGLLPQTETEDDLYLGSFYRRVGDEAKATSGLPDIPAEWKVLILNTPIEAKVTQVQKVSDWKFIVTVDKGSRHGLRTEMRLFSAGAEYVWLFNGYVRSVSAETAEVVFYSEVKIGDVVSTRFKGTAK